MYLRLAAILVCWTLAAHEAFGQECPPQTPICKIITVTPEEENALVGQNAILDAALFANRMGLGPAIEHWRNKITAAPRGTPPKKPEEKK